MRGWLKAVIWALIRLACAAVGAFVASRSNLFPPEVRVSPPPSPADAGPTSEPPAHRTLTMVSRTSHAYHVGGSCTSDWRMRAQIRVTDDGAATGRGVAHLLPGAGCDFPTAQVQSRSVSIAIEGERS